MEFNRETNVYTVEPEDRTRALFYYFGWKGGTIHQLAKETGLSTSTLLHRPISGCVGDGLSAIRTCSLDWRRDRLAPKSRGNWGFWASAIVGFWATGPLDEVDQAPRRPSRS